MELRLMLGGASSDRIMADSKHRRRIEDEFPEARGKVGLFTWENDDGDAGFPVSLVRWVSIGRTFCCVGTLEPRKNLRRLLGAFAMVPEDLRKRKQLVIAGGMGGAASIFAVFGPNLAWSAM
jgi:glycosyltransferase involved in cell wall biosynthesis